MIIYTALSTLTRLLERTCPLGIPTTQIPDRDRDLVQSH